MFPHCDPDFLDDSFLSSEIDDPLDESFKVDLETSDDGYESQAEDSERISSSCKFIVFWEMLSQLLIFCFKCRKLLILKIYIECKGKFARGNINVY